MSLSPRERQLLGLLAVAAAIAGLWWLTRAGGGLGSLPMESENAGGGVDLEAYDVAVLDVDELRSGPSEYPVGRNPWSFGPAPVPTYTPPPRPAPRAETPRPRPQPATTVEQGPPPRQLPKIDVTFLGSFGPERHKIAVFTDRDDTIYNLRIGDVLKDSFRVHQIGYESVDLAYVEFPEEPPARLALGDS